MQKRQDVDFEGNSNKNRKIHTKNSRFYVENMLK